MLTTVTIGSHISVQGYFLKALANGLVQVKVGEKIFAGRPVSQAH